MRYIKKCPKCNNEMYYDDERDAYCCHLCQICMPSLGHKKDSIDKENKNDKE